MNTNSNEEAQLVDWAEISYGTPADEHGFDDYRTTGEGGLFAYATWSLHGVKNNCFVDTVPHMGRADVVVDSVGPDSEDFKSQAVYASHEDSEDYEVSTPISIYLGSTPHSLYNDLIGDFFTVTKDKLNEKGKDVIEALEALYGPATFTTYLDT